jgi:hypothetical protein
MDLLITSETNKIIDNFVAGTVMGGGGQTPARHESMSIIFANLIQGLLSVNSIITYTSNQTLATI